MKAICVLLLSTWAASGAINRSPANCSSRPCTYTLTCATATCTTAESAELQTVLDEAWLGDIVKLQAGRTWTGTSSNFSITGRSGTGWLTITTTLDDRLPGEGVRITPHYRDVMPTIRNGAGSTIALRLVQGSSPARFIRFVGVRFNAQSGAAPLIRVGEAITAPEQDVEDVVFDRCIMENDQWFTNVGALVGYRGDRVHILNSYLQGATKYSSETQVISFLWGEHKILNNYIADATGENVMFGGTGVSLAAPPHPVSKATSSGEFAYNAVINHEERIRYKSWAANTRYFKSSVVNFNGTRYVATASCTEGSSFGSGCAWSSTSTDPTVKNSFEIKNAKDMLIHHNTFSQMWVDAQYETVVFKLTNCPTNSGSNCDCVPPFTGLVNTSGATVTSADGNPLPDLYYAGSTSGTLTSAKTININGADYTIVDFDLSNPDRLFISTSAGTQNNVPYSYGDSNCKPAFNRNTTFEHNVVRHTPQPWQVISMNNAMNSRIGNIRVRNNLFYDVDCTRWTSFGAGCGQAKSISYFAQVPFGLDYSNNTTVLFANMPEGMRFEGKYGCRGIPRGEGTCGTSDMPIAGDTRFANNILTKGTSLTLAGYTPFVSNSSVPSAKICDGGCTKEKWDGNILAGADIAGYPAGTYNLCPTTGSCTVDFEYIDPTYGQLFENYVAGNWKVRTGHYAQTGGMYGRQIGADWDALPIITRPSDGGIGVDVSATSSTVTLSYRVTAPLRHIPCVVEASTTPDIEGGRIADLDAATYLRPDVDGPLGGISRSVTIGSRVPLTASTTYFVRLHCGGGFWEGEVTTQ